MGVEGLEREAHPILCPIDKGQVLNSASSNSLLLLEEDFVKAVPAPEDKNCMSIRAYISIVSTMFTLKQRQKRYAPVCTEVSNMLYPVVKKMETGRP